MTDSTVSTAPARKAATRGRSRKTARRSPARKAPAAASRQAKALRAMLTKLSKNASRAGARVASLSREGGGTARKAAGKARAATRRAVAGSVREWKKLDTPRKIEFVAAIISALAAASGAVARGRKKKLSARAGSLLKKALR